MSLPCRQTVNALRQGKIALRYATRVVRRQVDLDPVVDIEPLGVVVHRFGQQRDATHEAECFDEIRKSELALQPVFVHMPAM